MNKTIDLKGKTFNRLFVIERADNNENGKSRWLCECICGNIKIILSDSLKSGKTKSCGCLNKEIIFNRKNKYIMNHKSEYRIWKSIKQRCTNPKVECYKNYGGRGITICERWLKFENFLKDIGKRPGKQYSIDRIDNNLGYYKNNCRWATKKEQQRNMRSNLMITFNNKIQCLTDWATEYKIPYTTLWHRLYKFNWSVEKALTTPARINIYDEIDK